MNNLQNRSIFVGRILKPTTQFQANGSAILKFSMGITKVRLDENKKRKYETTYINNFVAFGKQAEGLEKLFKNEKMSAVVEAEFAPNTWEDKSGVKHYGYSFFVREVLVTDWGVNGADDDVEDSTQQDVDEDFPF